MARMEVENPKYYDELIGGTSVNLITKNITITPGTALERGTVVTDAGAKVAAGDTAYGVVANAVTATDAVATIYVAGLFNREKLIVDDADDINDHEDELRDVGIFLTSLK